MTKLFGAWSGHDANYYISIDEKPIIHNEYERHLRLKEPKGDSVQYMFDTYDDYKDIKYIGTCYPLNKLTQYNSSFNKIMNIVNKNNGQLFTIGHHRAHAGNAFYSSNFESSLIITCDGGGVENENGDVTSFTIWEGIDNKIYHLHTFPINKINIGAVWTRATRTIFNLQSGFPRGHQAGSTMALAAFGNPNHFRNDFYKMLTSDLQQATFKHPKQPDENTGNDPEHPYLQKWREIADRSMQNKYDLAAGLQASTEKLLVQLFTYALSLYDKKQNINLSLSGGVVLNSVFVGKIKSLFPQINNVYVTPTPHDGGLTIGASQVVWHDILDNKRIIWKDDFSPYLGKIYSKQEIFQALETYKNEIEYKACDDNEIINLLDEQKIIAVFGGGSESGRRALGNRSIIVDPRNIRAKDELNIRVKHRQPWRPFAPSILKERVNDWFEEQDVNSPYMSFVATFKEDKRHLVPAVVHKDNTGRVQTVTENNNRWWYNFLTLWEQKTGIPILLNTSFNDATPICETPEHAIQCFLGTDIDYVYFYDENILVSKRQQD